MFNLKGEDDGQMEADNAAGEGNNTGEDSDSNSENGKRGKYKTYTDDEKNHIINFVRTLKRFLKCLTIYDRS